MSRTRRARREWSRRARSSSAAACATVPGLREWVGDAGAFSLRARSRILVHPRDRLWLQPETRTFAADLRRLTGRPVRMTTRRAPARTGDIRLRLGSTDRALGDEGYRLRIGRTLTIEARTPAGAFYGTRTVLQLLRRGTRIPAGRARDWPRYPERGLMLDAGRKYFTPGWIEARIKELASLKLNYLHLHLSDNQGFRIESETHPEIVSREHLTKEDVGRIVALARRLHVTVVPEIDMPGHMQAALVPHPELQLTDATGRRSPDRLDVTKPEALRFARDLIEEYLPLFPGPYWHTGADEYMHSVDYPLHPQLEAHARARYGQGANAKDAVHGFVNEIDRIVRAHGRTLRLWHDDLGGGSAVIVEPDTVVEWWTDISPLSDLSPPTPQELLAAGHRVMNAGWFPTYYVVGPLGAVRPDMRTAYESWEVHEFTGPLQTPPHTVAPDEPRNLGSKLHVWNDDPEGQTEDEIAAGSGPRLRVIAQKTWGTALPAASYDDFRKLPG